MAWPSLPNTFAANTRARSAEVNANFTAIINALGSYNAVSNADYTVTTTDGYRSILMTTGNTNRTVNLPDATAAANAGRIITIAKVDSGTGSVTVDGNSTQTISGQSTITLNVQWDFVTIQCDGSNWVKIASSSSSSASGSGRPNYITLSSKSSDMESTITGWNTYKDAAASTPADGTGGSSTLTLSRNTTTPLSGIADLKIAKPASNVQGEGFSIDVTIPSGYQYGNQSEIALLLDFSAMGSAGDWVCYAYDVTNSTLLTPRSTSIPKYKGLWYTDFFQPSTCTQLRLIFHCATTSTSSYNVFVDDVIFGPGGAPVAIFPGSEWTSYTPTTQGLGTLASSSVYYCRVGSNIEVRGFIDTGTTTASSVKIGLPSGLTIDSTKIPGDRKNILGFLNVSSSGGGEGPFTDARVAVIMADASDYTAIFATIDNGTDASGNTMGAPTAGSTLINSGGQISFHFSAPISQWAGSVYSGANDVEYVYNSSTSNGGNTSSFAYGPSGGTIPNITQSLAASTQAYRVRFQSPIQATDRLFIEIQVAGTGPWIPLENVTASIQPFNYNGGNYVGMYLYPVSGSTTDIDVFFGTAGAYNSGVYASGTAGNYNTWATLNGNGTKYRVKKVSGGAAVGFGMATSTQAGLVSKEDSGSFTITWNSTTPVAGATTTVKYSRVGNIVTLMFPRITGTSTSSTNYSGTAQIPAALRTVTFTDDLTFPIRCTSGSTTEVGRLQITPSTGDISILENMTTGSFTSGNSIDVKAISISYVIV